MRLDTASPRTWLLAAAAGWAVLTWVLAIAGMAGHIEPKPDDPALAKPLPAVPKVQASRLGAIDQYAVIAERPLWATDRRFRQFYLNAEGTQSEAKAFDFILTSVLLTPTLKMAILQPPDGSKSLRVKLGEAPEDLPAWRLSALNERSAVFEGPEGQRALDLRVYNGTGGQQPTPIATGSAVRPGGVSITPPSSAPERPGPQGPAEVEPPRTTIAPAPAATPPSGTAPAASAPMTEQAQMEAIRKRIEARRAQLRQEAARNQPTQPVTK